MLFDWINGHTIEVSIGVETKNAPMMRSKRLARAALQAKKIAELFSA